MKKSQVRRAFLETLLSPEGSWPWELRTALTMDARCHGLTWVLCAALTMDVRCHGLMGILFTLHEQQELLPRRNVCDYSVEDLQRSGTGGREDRQEQALTKSRTHTRAVIQFFIF